MLYGKYQMSRIPSLTFEEALAYTTKDNPDAVITVGIIKDGQVSYQVYGENGAVLPAGLHTYEIGSLTKTFTALLISKAIREGKIHLDDTIDHYLPLPGGNKYPTVKKLLTHTSGYKAYYFESPMIANFFKNRNDFYGITKEMVLAKADGLSMDKESHGFVYSNYGYAVLGLVLEAVYDTDAYLSAGAITSNISDMLSCAQMQLEGNAYFAACHNSLKTINASTEAYKAMGIRMDEIGMSWIIDSENGIVWHNGGTGSYNSYLGFHPETGTAVVVLSNLAPGYRIPAAVLGAKQLLLSAEKL